MNALVFLLSVVVGLMIAEARVSSTNEQRLRARGAIEPAGDVYRLMAWLYPACFLDIGAEGLGRAAHAGSPMSGIGGPSWTASGVVLFVASKVLKYWAIRSLGERWTFKVLVLPGVPLVRDGPYRYVAHPNYIAVVGELVGAAMMFGARITGPVMVIAFGLALLARLKFEQRALQE
ncbi:MAG TPA: isoprenylcysteine carboxylmethyltransferase family protein [Vicinamibacterales bacterium]|nr:isoprenylcysteine carboxylmethyltransferase family protein [Vicinamibacterales bacterium]